MNRPCWPTLTICALALLLGACQNLPFKGGKPAEEPAQAKLPVPHPPVQAEKSTGPQMPLDQELLYGLLVGEIAAKRGQYDVAYTHLLAAAEMSGDSKAAERATYFARLSQNNESVMKAVGVWGHLDPNSLPAQQIAAVSYAHADQPEQALVHLRETVRLANESGQDGYLQAGLVAAKLGKPEMSVNLMEQLVQGDQANPKAWYAYSVVAIGAARLPLAETAAHKALELQPGWPEGSVLLSRVLLAEEKPDEAQRVLETALKRSPDQSDLGAAYARLLVDRKDYEGAYKQYARLLKSSPEDSELLFPLGILALQLDKPKEAEGYFGRLLKTGRRADVAHFYLAQVAELEDDPETAIRHFSEAKGEYLLESQIQIARLYAEEGEISRSRELLQQLRARVPDEAVRLYLVEAELLRDAGESEAVFGVYSQALAEHPGEHRLLYARGLHAANNGQLELMEQDLRKVLDEDPENADALNALGYTLADQTDRYEEALSYIKRALAMEPDSAAVLDSMGWVQFRLGNLDESVRYLSQAMEAVPDPEIALHLGQALWAQGNQDQAKQVWRDALKDFPEDEALKQIIEQHR